MTWKIQKMFPGLVGEKARRGKSKCKQVFPDAGLEGVERREVKIQIEKYLLSRKNQGEN